jgi:hypothetical protein
MSDSKCMTYHRRRGLVSTHPPGTLPVSDAHMSVVSCDRPNCIRAWKGYVTPDLYDPTAGDPVWSELTKTWSA